MKPSSTKLGLKIQQLLLEKRLQVDDLASAMGITADGLSNLIHGRRRFKDDTLEKLADTPIFKDSGITVTKLKAWRAMDEYSFEEIILALIEYVRQGEIDRLNTDFFLRFQDEMETGGFPADLAGKKRALLTLIQEDHS